MNGKFVVIEGCDASGKKTQSLLLKKALENKGITVKLIDFPQYQTPFGSLVTKYLKGEYGSKEKLPPEIPSLLYALDRYQFKDSIFKDLKNGVCIISDRYIQSNLGFQGAKLEGEERTKLIEWIKNTESRLPQPDVIIYLHIPAEKSKELLDNRESQKHDGDKKDIHEIDLEYQKKVIETYLQIAKKDNWIIIDCIKNNKIKKPEEIHKEVWSKIEGLFR